MRDLSTRLLVSQKGVDADASVLPDIRPSLLLDFAKVKRLDPRITFARADATTCATYFDAFGILKTSAANLPRFDHDPATGASLGLLIEESRQNLLTYSSTFDNAAWTTLIGGTGVTPVLTANAGTAPDGTNTAYRLQANRGAGNTVTDQSTLRQQITGLSNPHAGSLSIWVKSNTGVDQTVYFRNVDASASNNFTATTSWQRVSCSTASYAATTDTFQIGSRGTQNATNSVDILIWGAEFEAAASPTSYIPTTSAAVTRAADPASMAGTNFSSWYNQTAGCIVVTFVGNASGTRTVFDINDGTANERIYLQSSSGVLTLKVIDGGVEQCSIALGSVVTGVKYTVAAAWQLNDVAVSINGGSVVTDVLVTLPTPTRLQIGTDGTNYLNGHISRLAYYPRRLSNSVLQGLTS